MLKYVNRSPSKSPKKSPTKSPDNRESLTGFKLDFSESNTQSVKIKRRCSSALPRSRNTSLRPSHAFIYESLQRYRKHSESGEETNRKSLRQIRRTNSTPKLTQTIYSTLHARKLSASDLRSSLKPKEDISRLNVLGTTKQLIEPQFYKSKQEYLNSSPRKNSDLFIQVKVKRNTAPLFKSQTCALQDKDKLNSDCFMKILRITKNRESMTVLKKNAWSDTRKSIIVVGSGLKTKSEELSESYSDESSCSIHKAKYYKTIKSPEETKNLPSPVKSHHSNTLFSLRTSLKSSETKPKPKLDESKEKNIALSCNSRIETMNINLKPYIYANVTRKRLYNKLNI